MLKWSNAAFPIILLGLLSCASSSGVVQLSPDTYMIRKEDKAGIFGSMSKLKAGVIREANAFAARQGKIAIPISSNEKPVGYRPGDWAWFEYQFRVVDKDDPEAKRTALLPGPDLSVESRETVQIDVKSSSERGDEIESKQSAPVTILSSVPNAEVYIDGTFVGNAPVTAYPLSAGVHVIQVRAPRFAEWKRELRVADGVPVRVIAQLENEK